MATRYWVGGGSSSNWNATGNTNWSATSGGANNASVPTSADDVIFDGAGATGDTNSTISAAITIKSLDIQTGYTATMTHNAVLTIAGNWTLGANYTIAGASGVTLSQSTATITSNGRTWPNNLALPTSGTASIKTLVGDFTIGSMSSSGGFIFTIDATTTERITILNGMNMSSGISGTATFYLNGGTLSLPQNVIVAALYLDGNITFGSSVNIQCPFRYLSGTITTTGSTLFIWNGAVLDLAAITLNNVRGGQNLPSLSTVTLESDLYLSGSYIQGNNYSTNINEFTIYVAGGLTMTTAVGGTTKFILQGGTWSGSASILNNLDIDGNVTISGTVTKSGGTLTYVSGTVTTAGSTVTFSGNNTISSGAIIWNNISFATNGSTKTLIGDIECNLLNFAPAAGVIINKTTSEKIVCKSMTYISTVSRTLTGDIDIYVTGELINTFQLSIRVNLFLNGNIKINGDFLVGDAILTYLSGTINTSNSTLRTRFLTMIGFNKAPLRAIVVNAGAVLTFDEFPCGTASQICSITSTGTNYTIQFQDNFEKMARFVAISGATLARPQQLVLTNNSRFNTNRSTNIGVRYINQSPNGFSKNRPSINDTMTVPALGLVGDPNFQRQ
jgi:hypothetical protein